MTRNAGKNRGREAVMKRITAILLLACLLNPQFTLAANDQPASKPAAAASVLPANGALLDLVAGKDGGVFHQRKDGKGEIVLEPVDGKALKQVSKFLAKLPKDDAGQALALSLRSYLAPRMDPKDLDNNTFLAKDDKGRYSLTELGRNSLFDILAASDGALIEPLVEYKPEPKPEEKKEAPGGGKDPGAPPQGPIYACTDTGCDAGSLASFDAADLAGQTPDAAFDNQNSRRHAIGGFDWGHLDEELAAARPGTTASVAPEMLNGYSVDRERNTVRVMVAANTTVQADRIKSATPEDAKKILEETGLDSSLFTQHGAKVVRAVDNIVTIDVPLDQAAKLGLALEGQGVESRPARVFRAASAALTGTPGALLGMQFMPVPSLNPLAKEASQLKQDDKMVQSRSMLAGEELWKKGMKGQGTLVGVIDSGIDPDHADFKDKDGKSRVQDYLDFTDEGKDDVVGHGTHVSGSLGGNGAASDGKFAGLAPETRFRVAKGFGTKGETDESVILAAMKWMVSDKDNKVDVLNMSLGGPGEPNKDPLSSMANHLVVDNNVLVVAAAGNEGAAGFRSVGSPGSSRYVLTVTGVNKDGEFPFFASKGPSYGEDGDLYNKPDISAVAGDVDLKKLQQQMLLAQNAKNPSPVTTPVSAEGQAGLKAVPGLKSGGCIYAPGGVIAPRSGADPDTVCTVDGQPGYRYMSGTSMATPMVAGMAADVIGYMKQQGAEVDAFQVKALLMETSVDLKKAKEQQGSGLANGERLVSAVTDRVARGLPVGNVAYMLSTRLTTNDVGMMKSQTRYQLTPLGLFDTQTNRLLNNETEIQNAIDSIRKPPPTMQV